MRQSSILDANSPTRHLCSSAEPASTDVLNKVSARNSAISAAKRGYSTPRISPLRMITCEERYSITIIACSRSKWYILGVSLDAYEVCSTRALYSYQDRSRGK